MQDIIVTEVGLRDGLQNERTVLTTNEKVELLQALVAVGLKKIELTSFVSPKLVPQLADAKELCGKLINQEEIEYSALVGNIKGFDRALEAGVKFLSIPLSVTETMNRKNLNMGLAEAKSVTLDIIKRAKKEGMGVRVYIAVAFGCPFEGTPPPERILEFSSEMLENSVDEVSISDTIGVGNPYQVSIIFEKLASKIDTERLSAHFHDTRGMALANVLAAQQAGIRRFDGSIGGLGGCPFSPGASGNLATEDLVGMLYQGGFETGVDMPKLGAAISVAESLVKRPIGGRMRRWLQARASD